MLFLHELSTMKILIKMQLLYYVFVTGFVQGHTGQTKSYLVILFNRSYKKSYKVILFGYFF